MIFEYVLEESRSHANVSVEHKKSGFKHGFSNFNETLVSRGVKMDFESWEFSRHFLRGDVSDQAEHDNQGYLLHLDYILY